MPTVRPADLADTTAVADFLAAQLAGSGGAARYRRYLECSWAASSPNLGFVVEDAGAIRGFAGAMYADRRIRGGDHRFCNIHSVAVDPAYRKRYSLPLLKRLLDQPGYTFTTFSPSDRLVEIFAFFKFVRLDQDKAVFTPLAGLGQLRPGTRVHRGAGIDRALIGDEHRLYADHRRYRCGHFVVERGDRRCYLVTVRRGRDVRVFADVLHASDPQLAVECIAHLHVPVALTHGTALIGLDRRWVPSPPLGTFIYDRLRPRMVKLLGIELDDVDGLYSEFVPMYG